MAANTKQRKGFKERKARNRRLLDEARNHQMNKRNNMIRMIQEQMQAAEAKKKDDLAKDPLLLNSVSAEMPMDGTVVKMSSDENGKPVFIQDEETQDQVEEEQGFYPVEEVDPNA